MYIDVSVTASNNRYGGGSSEKFSMEVPDSFLAQVQDKIAPALSELIVIVINKQASKKKEVEEVEA